MVPTDHNIDVRGLELHYLEWGNREREPMVLVHGFLDHARSWEPFVASVKKRSQKPGWIVAPDCRGHGDSGWIGAGGYYHFSDYVLDLDALIHVLGCDSVTLMGHSMGGTISFLYAGTFPKRVRRLILVEGIGPQGLSFSEAPLRMEKWILDVKALRKRRSTVYSTPEQAAQRLRRKDPNLSWESARHLAQWGMKRTDNGKWAWKFDPLHRTIAPQPFYTGQAVEFLRCIECPVLLIRGKDSRQAARPDLDKRLEALTDRTLVEVKDAGHMVHHDNPEGLAKAVVQFLNR
ncbi:MAG: alpha/beta fold hydrolase [Candidatus Binatia bacterium]